MAPLPVNEKRASELRTIVEIPEENLRGLLDQLKNDVRFLHFKELTKLFQSHAGQDAGKKLLNHTASLNLMRDKDAEVGSEIFDRLHEGVVEYGEDAELEAGLVKLKPLLIKLFEDETVYLSAKGSRLFAANTLHLHEFKTYCDARPVFGPNRQNVHAFLLFASMHIVASDHAEEEQTISVALRESDLRDVINECQTALEKLEATEKSLSLNNEVGIIRYGNE